MTRDHGTSGSVVRISIGRVDPARTEDVVSALQASEDTLRPAIASLPGLIAYYVGVDRDSSTITNTSVWRTREYAKAMSSLREMADLRGVFEELGVVFEPIANHDVLWEI